MLFRSARMACSEALHGVIYTPEEVGAHVDGDGDPVGIAATVVASEHDPSWEADRSRFCAYLGGRGWDYDQVAEFCQQLGKPRPSSMSNEARHALVRWLDGAGADRWAAFCGASDDAAP